MFDFEYGSWEAGHSAYRSEIMCYDKDMDIGLLRLQTSKKFDNVATMFPRGEHKKRLRLFQPVYAIGCGLGHPPLQTRGQLAGFTDVIDNYPYWLSTAPTIFGNSGGSVYRGDTFEFIGIPSRIAVMATGFSADAITHMSYFIPMPSIYNFLEDQLFNFIFDSSGNFFGKIIDIGTASTDGVSTDRTCFTLDRPLFKSITSSEGIYKYYSSAGPPQYFTKTNQITWAVSTSVDDFGGADYTVGKITATSADGRTFFKKLKAGMRIKIEGNADIENNNGVFTIGHVFEDDGDVDFFAIIYLFLKILLVTSRIPTIT